MKHDKTLYELAMKYIRHNKTIDRQQTTENDISK